MMMDACPAPPFPFRDVVQMVLPLALSRAIIVFFSPPSLGNHDMYHDPALVRRRLRGLGVRVLGNGWEQIDVRGEPPVGIGNETPWFRPALAGS